MKQKYINSISLFAVCAVLNGCGDNSNKQKSVSELKADLAVERQRVSALSTDALREAVLSGVPLPEGTGEILRKNIETQTDSGSTTSVGLMAELARTTDELGTLMDSGAYVRNQAYWKLVRAKAEELKTQRELAIAQLIARRVAAAHKSTQTPAEVTVEDYPLVPNNSFAEPEYSRGSALQEKPVNPINSTNSSPTTPAVSPITPVETNDSADSPSVSPIQGGTLDRGADPYDVSLPDISSVLSRSSSTLSSVGELDSTSVFIGGETSGTSNDGSVVGAAAQKDNDSGSKNDSQVIPSDDNASGTSNDGSTLVVPRQGTFSLHTETSPLAAVQSGIFAAFTGIQRTDGETQTDSDAGKGAVVPSIAGSAAAAPAASAVDPRRDASVATVDTILTVPGGNNAKTQTTKTDTVAVVPRERSFGTQTVFPQPIDAAEAVRLGVEAMLRHTLITGGVLEETASPAIVDAVRKASVLALLDGTP